MVDVERFVATYRIGFVIGVLPDSARIHLAEFVTAAAVGRVGCDDAPGSHTIRHQKCEIIPYLGKHLSRNLRSGEHRVQTRTEEHFSAVDIADASDYVLIHQLDPDRRSRTPHPVDEALPIRVLAKRIRTEFADDGESLGLRNDLTRRRAGQICDSVSSEHSGPHLTAGFGRDEPAVGIVGSSVCLPQSRNRFLFADPAAGRANCMFDHRRIVPCEGPRPVQAEVHANPSELSIGEAEPEEHLLTEGLDPIQASSINERGTSAEAPLRAAHTHMLACEELREDPGEPVDRVALRHGDRLLRTGSACVLVGGKLVNAPLMTLVTAEGLGKERVSEGHGLLNAVLTAPDRNDVGIVVLAGQLGRVEVPSERSTHPGNLVGSDLLTVAGPTDDDSEGARISADCFTSCETERGVVVESVIGVGSMINYFMPLGSKVFDEMGLEVVASMIGSNVNAHRAIMPYGR